MTFAQWIRVRQFVIGAAAFYVLTGALFAFTVKRVIPAVNWRGAVYYGAVWPAWPLSVALNRRLLPVPAWAFTFDARNPA